MHRCTNRIRWLTSAALCFLSATFATAHADAVISADVVWKNPPEAGRITVRNGTLATSGTFQFISGDTPSPTSRLSIAITDAQLAPGGGATIVSVASGSASFSFFLRDVNATCPVWIPAYEVAVLPGGDPRSYEDVRREITAKNLSTKLQLLEEKSETSFASVEKLARNMSAPVWLGISRDVRIFEISEELEDTGNEDKVIRPKFAYTESQISETGGAPVYYRYALGRGVGPCTRVVRRLEDGALPIYQSILRDDDVEYRTVSFVSFEKSALTASSVAGTDYMISDHYSAGRVFTSNQKKQVDEILSATPAPAEELVLYSRTEIENTGKVPRYAWIKAPRPAVWGAAYSFDGETGFSRFSKDRVFCVSALNGKKLRSEETAILLMPGEKAEYCLSMPHEPVTEVRAAALATQSFAQRQAECREYWRSRLREAASINVPEKRIQEMLQAGLLHLELITYGREPSGPLAANVGIYSPIGTESAPIIQFYLSMGLDELARRSLDYFLQTQQESGAIQNYSGYTIETGAVLWDIGEYYRYTRDKVWIAAIEPKLLKAADYLIAWRDRNKNEAARGKGFGMIDGKVADPEDPFHQFMLNGYACMGMSRLAEMLAEIDPARARRIAAEAADWKKDIRETFFKTMTQSPVVPLGDGSWTPTAPPWAEAVGLRSLYIKNENVWSHGTFVLADSLLGPMHLIFCEVLESGEPVSQMLFRYDAELLLQRNVAFSQPYYSRHNWYQARQGMVKPFLDTYYTTMAAHADRDTYTFWEHMYRQSSHKTHEEANFLMETRWMLYMEENKKLRLFGLIPRTWLEDGKKIEIDGARSYFGKLRAGAESHVANGSIEAFVECPGENKPAAVTIRLPHPEGKKPVAITGGSYDPATETVTIEPFSGAARVRLEF